MERDDIIEYSLDAHHSEEQGRKIRKNIWKVTYILTLITAVEVAIGIIWPRSAMGAESWSWWSIKMGYLLLTLIKAAYIVLIFMHLGDERKSFKWTILAPYALFICYLIFIILTEATYNHEVTEPWGAWPGAVK